MNDPREGAALGAIDLDKNDGGIADDRGVGHKIMYDLLFARATTRRRGRHSLALMPKSVRQVQAKMGQFGYILVHGYLPLKIYPNGYIPRKHNHRTYVHYVESYSVSKVSLNNI